MQFGTFEIFSVSDSPICLDGGAVFGIVPRVFWERIYPPDDKHRIQVSLQSLLVVTKRHTILIDTGVGSKLDAKYYKIYGIDKNITLLKSLSRLGYQPQDIDIVINTHLHFDHAGGNTYIRDDGKTQPTFPKATYFIQKGEMDDALHPNERTRASYLPDDFVPIADSRQLGMVDDETAEVDKGVSLIRTGGHTRQHQCVRIESEGQTAFFLADLVPTVAHLQLPYIAGYDLYPLTTLEQKRNILEQAHKERWLLIFQHDPKTLMGYLKKTEKGFEIEEGKTC